MVQSGRVGSPASVLSLLTGLYRSLVPVVRDPRRLLGQDKDVGRQWTQETEGEWMVNQERE